MSVPFSGLNVTVDYTATSATDIMNETNAALVLANWSSVAAGGGFDVTSATTPQGHAVTVELRISGTAMTALFRDDTAMPAAADPAVRLRVNPQDMRIVASPYQFFTYEIGDPVADNRTILMGGVPFIPTFLEAGTTEAWWMMVSFTRNTFRGNVDPVGYQTAVFNGSRMEATSDDNAYLGRISIIPPRSTAGGNPSEILWYDGSALDAECLIAWGQTRDVDKKAIGLLWDMVCIWDAFPVDDEQSFGGKTWISISTSTQTPSLWVVKE